MISFGDGLDNLIKTAPAPLKDLGGRLVDRFVGPNGSHTVESTAKSIDVFDNNALQPLLLEAGALAMTLLSEEERSSLTVGEALEEAASKASPEQMKVIYKLQGAITLMPSMANQKLSDFLNQS